jgi:hypothetical protein
MSKTKSMPQDYLKYWRVIRQFIKVKYGILQADLDMLLFLYSESYFNKDKFQEFTLLVPWDKNRFDKLLRDGWIVVFREYNRKTKEKALYELSYKARRMIVSIYKKLSGEEIPITPGNNPMFAKNVSYTDGRYKRFIMRLNAETKRQRHRAPE